jgi:hypothetical protein
MRETSRIRYNFIIMDMSQDIATASLNLAESVHERHYEGIIVSGGSNQLSRSLFTSAWMAQYPEEQIPHIYILDARANEMLYKEELAPEESKVWMQHWIDEKIPALNDLKGEKLCFIDDFSATGTKINDVEKAFKELGFAQVDFFVFAARENTEINQEVFVAAHGDEIVRELQDMSMNIRGEPSIKEIANRIASTGEERRLRALEQLREIGRRARGR